MTVRKKHIRSLVERILTSNSISSAPVPVEDLARRLGADVRRSPADESLSGFLLRESATGRAIIGVNNTQSRSRQRFTIGHELGHFLLHSTQGIHVDRANGGFQIRLRSDESSTGTNPEEIEANVFAAELLMPASFLKADLAPYWGLDFSDKKILDEMLSPLADKYEVSEQALTYRLINLEYVLL